MTDKKEVYRPSTHILEERSIEEFQEIEESQYEDKIVKYMFRRYRLPDDVRFAILKQQKQEHGFGRLTLPAFYEHYPTFPIYLFSRRLRKLKDESPLYRWFSDFARRSFVKQWDELVQTAVPEEFEDRPVGLIFPWPYVRMKEMTSGKAPHLESKGSLGLVIHDRPIDLEAPGVRFHWKSPSGEALTVEPLPVLFNTMDVSGKWRP